MNRLIRYGLNGPAMKRMAHRTPLADDIRGCVEFLSVTGKFKMVARARSGSDALEMTQHMHPDVILMDFVIPDMNVLEVIGQIKSRPEAPHVVIFSDDYRYRKAALWAGADGFVGKTEFGPRMLARLERLCDSPAKPKGVRAASRTSRPDASPAAMLIVVLSCLLVGIFLTWH